MYYCSYAPISWKTYPFLDFPLDGASVGEKINKILTQLCAHLLLKPTCSHSQHLTYGRLVRTPWPHYLRHFEPF